MTNEYIATLVVVVIASAVLARIAIVNLRAARAVRSATAYDNKVDALTAENVRLAKEVADLRGKLDHVEGFITSKFGVAWKMAGYLEDR